jgi:glycosidase
MPLLDNLLGQPRPESLDDVTLPASGAAFPSSASMQNEILYFLLVDRFSDGGEANRPLLNRNNLTAARPSGAGGAPFDFGAWAESGAHRYQGGTIKGVQSKLAYLSALGVTMLWLSPVFKQRGHQNTYHGYGIQDFLDVDPRFGTRQDLVDLVQAAHAQDIRIILDIIFNHSGHNFNYDARETNNNVEMPPFRPFPDFYHQFGGWLNADGNARPTIAGSEDGVFPVELQSPERYSRAGFGNLGAGDLNDPHAEHKRTDFFTLRDLRSDDNDMLADLVKVYQYWIALTDCDGFRIDTLKHVAVPEARNFCGAIKEFAASIGKNDFFLVGEVAGGSFTQDVFFDALVRNINAVLDIGEARLSLTAIGKGFAHPHDYFGTFNELDPGFGSHRNVGSRHVSILNDHDHVFGDKVRFTPDLTFDHQIVAPIAVQLFTLGIPCIYYGSEQAFSLPEPSVTQQLPNVNGRDFADRYLREAMFGPEHPRRAGRAGLPQAPAGLDPAVPGFGPFATSGHHCFDETHPAFVRLAALNGVRQRFPVLRFGRQYLRPHDIGGHRFVPGGGSLIGWSRILGGIEALVLVNSNGTQSRQGRVLIDANLNQAGGTMTVIANSAESAAPAGFAGPHRIGTTVPVEKDPDGATFVTIGQVGPSEVLILTNQP